MLNGHILTSRPASVMDICHAGGDSSLANMQALSLECVCTPSFKDTSYGALEAWGGGCIPVCLQPFEYMGWDVKHEWMGSF